MDKIKENDKIKHLVKLAEISKGIIAKVQAMPDIHELKLDLDIILHICNIIENNIKQNETKSIDKKNRRYNTKINSFKSSRNINFK